MALSNEQLLMLEILIYSDRCADGQTVENIIDGLTNDIENGRLTDYKYCQMTTNEWRTLIASIRNEPELLGYTVTNYTDSNPPLSHGARAACFVDNKDHPTDINVVFRGTGDDYEWHDNGEGAYLSDTHQQEDAANYVENLPDAYGNNLTVVGHSKGGNKAQYVTIVTDRISKCVSYDGQGFSQEFLDKYYDEIRAKSDRITSISAANDFVNCLLYPIAGKRIYIETEGQNNFLYYHKLNILLDGNGKMRQQTEQSQVSQLINEYTTYVTSNMDEPLRSYTVDGLIALLEKGEDKESWFQTILAIGVAASHLDDFVFNWIGEKIGIPAELTATYIASLLFPYIFIDDLLRAGKKALEVIGEQIKHCIQHIANALRKFGERASEYANKFINAAISFVNNVCDWYNRTFNAGYQYANEHPYVRLDTYRLHAYAQRIETVNRRVSGLDRRLDSLYWRVGFLDLWNLIQADLLTGYSWRLRRCVSYLNDTADDFELAESNLINNL